VQTIHYVWFSFGLHAQSLPSKWFICKVLKIGGLGRKIPEPKAPDFLFVVLFYRIGRITLPLPSGSFSMRSAVLGLDSGFSLVEKEKNICKLLILKLLKRGLRERSSCRITRRLLEPRRGIVLCDCNLNIGG
jgi:hypothetical protein